MPAFDKRAHMRELDREDLAKRRAKVAALAKQWHSASRALPERLAAVRTACKLERDALRSSCAADAARERSNVRATREAFRAVRDDESALRRAERHGKKHAPRATRAEKRSESDDEVRQNIPPEFLALFERIKRQIKPHARSSRTETFLKYVEEHPSEVFEATAAKAEKEIHEHEKRERSKRAAKGVKKATPYHFEQQTDDDHAFRDLLANPSATFTELGRLTEITFLDPKKKSRRWPLSRAPILAVTPEKRLVVLYNPVVTGKAGAKERAKYTLLHWGNLGQGKAIDAYMPQGPWGRLGAAKSIVYTTKKGSRELVDFDHKWGDGAPRGKRVIPPFYAEHACRDAKCPQRGWLKISGGTYSVTTRGIVG